MDMRNLIVDRLEEIRNENSNFCKDNIKWKKFNVKMNDSEIHISDVDFNDVCNIDLVYLFEKVIKQYSRLM